METGRALLGVPLGVSLGVGDWLPNLALLAPDLGVMFEFRKALTGVETSSFDGPSGVTTLLFLRPFRFVEDVTEDGDPESRGKGVPAPASLGFAVGFPFAVVCLSKAMVKYLLLLGSLGR